MDIILTTYETLRRDWVEEGPLYSNTWRRLVLDEGKNYYAAYYCAAYCLYASLSYFQHTIFVTDRRSYIRPPQQSSQKAAGA